MYQKENYHITEMLLRLKMYYFFVALFILLKNMGAIISINIIVKNPFSLTYFDKKEYSNIFLVQKVLSYGEFSIGL